MSNMSMQCPNCSKGIIHYTIGGLMEGRSFRCDTCDVTIALGAESKSAVNDTFKKLNDLKQENS